MMCFFLTWTWMLVDGMSHWAGGGGVSQPAGAGWAFCPLPFPYSCHALAARKYWRVRMDPNPNISSAASVWSDQTPSIAINIGFLLFLTVLRM